MKLYSYLIVFDSKIDDESRLEGNYITQRKSKIKTRNIRCMEKFIEEKNKCGNVRITNVCYLGKEREENK